MMRPLMYGGGGGGYGDGYGQGGGYYDDDYDDDDDEDEEDEVEEEVVEQQPVKAGKYEFYVMNTAVTSKLISLMHYVD